MLRSVTRPDGKTVTFKYDALGRRKEKRFDGRIHRYLWDGNVVLHEWAYAETDSPQEIITEDGTITFDRSEPADNVITWVYDTDSYVPTAKIENGKTYSIVSDYIGRPCMEWARDGERKCDNLRWQRHAGATITRQQAVCERFCSPPRRWLHHPSRCRLCQSYPSLYKGR